MSPLGFLLIGVLITLPAAWLVSEFRGSRLLRVSLGVLALLFTSFCVWALTSTVTRFNYNAWYGGATENLIETSLHEIEKGHLDRVLKVWRGINLQYQPTYENRARYQELVEEATRRMRGETLIEPGSTWDAPMFGTRTWVGHWEDDHGYWLVMSDIGRPLHIIRSGESPNKMHAVSISSDFSVLKFKEGDTWAHTLTLRNKYEVMHEWFDLEKAAIWKTDTMHKLIRASDEQKRMTQRGVRTSASQQVRSETNQISPASASLR